MQRYKKFSKFSVFIRFTLVFQPAVLICFITSSAIAASVAGHSTATGVAMFTKEGFRRESMKLSRKKESTISELSIPLFYVDYPIFSQLKYPLFMLWTFTSIPYLFKNNCASIGRSRETPMGGIGETVLVSMNIPFSSRCLLSLQAALPLFLTTILQSAIIKKI